MKYPPSLTAINQQCSSVLGQLSGNQSAAVNRLQGLAERAQYRPHPLSEASAALAGLRDELDRLLVTGRCLTVTPLSAWGGPAPEQPVQPRRPQCGGDPCRQAARRGRSPAADRPAARHRLAGHWQQRDSAGRCLNAALHHPAAAGVVRRSAPPRRQQRHHEPAHRRQGATLESR